MVQFPGLSESSNRKIVRVLQTPNTPTLRPADLGVPEPQNLLKEVTLVQSTCVTWRISLHLFSIPQDTPWDTPCSLTTNHVSVQHSLPREEPPD